MNAPILLDTCAAIWLANEEPIAEEALAVMRLEREAGEDIFLSPITAWEIGLLASRKRLTLLITPQRWFERLMQAPGIRLAEMSVDVLIASSFLPGSPPHDPADRIIAATAREYGYKLMTRDRPLLDYAGQGHIEAIEC